ncbi:MAG: hypothetical protein JNL96_14245 [Planctomycetaceae bacterium]|nr:hypothetical protein [Planctomycetaceae bacterium]
MPATASPNAVDLMPRDSRARGVGRARSWPLWIAVAAFLATRVYFYAFFSASISDVGVYFQYVVQGVDYGQTPYKQVESTSTLRKLADLEYPPVAYWIMALPRELSSWRLPAEPVEQPIFNKAIKRVTPVWERYFELNDKHYLHYDKQFRALMLLFDVAGFALFGAILRRRAPDLLTPGLWGYTLATACLGYVLLERLDVVLTFFLVAWAYCRLRADDADSAIAWLWCTAGYASLGLGIAFKLIPVLAVPFALWSDVPALRNNPRDWKRLLGPLVLVVTAVLPFVYYYRIVGDDLWNMFRFHTARGVQIESSYAAWMMVFEPAKELTCYFDFGSWNLGGPSEPRILKWATILLPAALFVLGVRALAAPLLRERFDGAAAVRYATAAVSTATFLSKVFSVQYLLWAVPLLLLGAAEHCGRRLFLAVVAGAVVSCALTGWLFPYHYQDTMLVAPYSKENPPHSVLIADARAGSYEGRSVDVGNPSQGFARDVMVARNLLFGLLTTALFCSTLRRSPIG